MWIEPVLKSDANITNERTVHKNANLKKGQVACHLSHLQALKKLLQDASAQSILVFEDDLKVVENLEVVKHELEATMQEVPLDWDVLYLGKCWESCMHSTPVGMRVLQTETALCRHAIAFSRRAAEIVVDKTLPMTHSGDVMIRNLAYEKMLASYSLRSSIFFRTEKSRTNLRNYGTLRECK